MQQPKDVTESLRLISHYSVQLLYIFIYVGIRNTLFFKFALSSCVMELLPVENNRHQDVICCRHNPDSVNVHFAM
jgi:hypothetical protein